MKCNNARFRKRKTEKCAIAVGFDCKCSKIYQIKKKPVLILKYIISQPFLQKRQFKESISKTVSQKEKTDFFDKVTVCRRVV